MKGKIITILRLLAGIAILALLLYKVGISRISQTLSQAHLAYMIPSFLLYIFSVYIGATSLNLFMKIYSKIKTWLIFKYQMISIAISSLTPAKIGHVYLVLALRKHKIPLGNITGVILFQKMINLIILSTIAITGFIIFFSLEKTIYVILTLIFGILVAIASFFTKAGKGFIKKYILRKYSKKFIGFSKAHRQILKNHKRNIFLACALILISYLTMAYSVYYMFAALGFEAPILYLVIIGSVETIATLIPFTIAGLGVREGIGLYLYTTIGIPSPVAFSRYLLGLMMRYITAFFTILFIKPSHPNRNSKTA